MNHRVGLIVGIVFGICAGSIRSTGADDTFKIATYNLENYLLRPLRGRKAKEALAREKVREAILIARPDVLAVQELGSPRALIELQGALASKGLNLPNTEYMTGSDTNIHLAVLSRFPITARRSQGDLGFILYGRRFRVARGIAEVDIRVNPDYEFTLLNVHLKSKRRVPYADEADLREAEAKILRRTIDERLKANRLRNLVVVGDFNDAPNSFTIKSIIGKGRYRLTDTRPAEGTTPEREHSRRSVAWTAYYGLEDSYHRFDYVFLSGGMAREWRRAGSFVLDWPDWGLGSDHRPVVVSFFADDR